MWVIVLAAIIIIPILAWVIDLFDPDGCTCGAPGMLQFGIFVEHAPDCRAHPANIAERKRIKEERSRATRRPMN